MAVPFRHRRSLTHVGGAVETEGDPRDADRLAHALDVRPSGEDEEAARAHVHGFHTYPARMHPDTAARLVRGFAPRGGSVLDPFCGSGTVLVETLIAGAAPFGVDLNPLAVMLTRCKTRPRAPAELEGLVAAASACAKGANDRRRAGPDRRFSPEDVRLFEPHVLRELDSLRSRIAQVRTEHTRLDLSLILSSLLVKFSTKAGDTSRATVGRRTAPGFASRLFVQRAEDLARRLAALGRLVPNPVPAFVEQDDATRLAALPAVKVDAIITSPPYAATYDYVSHHDLRLRWLGLDAAPLAGGELGARSRYERIEPRRAVESWSHELERFLQAARGVLTPGGAMALLIADSAVGKVALRADEIVATAARACGLRPLARASQARPHFHRPTSEAFRNRPRFEHALLLRN